MAKIVGNVRPEDDYTHPLGPEQNFNESVYFNFFDREQSRGGFLRIGNRANEGYAELTVIVYNPDGSALFNYKRPAITSNDGWNAGGLSVEVLVPGEKLRTTYDGSVVYLADPRAMHDPGKAFKENPHKRLALDLVHEGVGPLYGHVGQTRRRQRLRARTLRATHEGVRHARGRGRARRSSSRGHGLRDHSWGPRYWQSTPSYRWITGNFGDDLGMVISIVGDRVGGVFHKGEELLRITAVELDTDYEAGTHYHSRAAREGHARGRLEARDRGPRARLHPAAQPPRRPEHAHRRGHDRVHARRRSAWASGCREYLDQNA